jgi:hypothetical protein
MMTARNVIAKEKPPIPLDRQIENLFGLASNCRAMAANLLSEARENERQAKELKQKRAASINLEEKT